jgi:hypothetical protein
MTDNHTIMISYPDHNVWITLLTSVNKQLKEFRFTFSDGVVRYATLDEIRGSEFDFIVNVISELEAIDESRLGLYENQLYVKN